MTPQFALGRLVWRPAALVVVFLFALAMSLALWEAPDISRWRAAIVFPALAGLFLSLWIRELQHTTFAWTVPGLPERLRNGKVIAGVALATILAVYLVRVADPDLAIAAFGLAMLCFALGGVALDPVLPKWQSHTAPVLLAVIAYRPVYVEHILLSNSLLTAAAGTFASLLLLLREFSPHLSRRRPLTSGTSMWTNSPGNARQYWSQHPARDSEWNSSLSGHALMSWIRAGIYESYGGAKISYGHHLVSFMVITVGISYWIGETSMVPIMAWIFLGTSGIQLSNVFLYPLNRETRARLFLISTAVEAVLATAAALAALLVLYGVGPRTADGTFDDNLTNMVTYVAVFFAWGPVAHWTKIRQRAWATVGSTSVAAALRYLGYQLVFIMLAMLSQIALTEWLALSSAEIWIIVAAVATTTHVIYWLAVQRYFAQRDLVAVR